MSFEQLRKIVGDNAEATALIDTLEESSSNNVKKINNLESKFEEAQKGRDSLKSLIKTGTGLEEVTEDTIKEFVTKMKETKGDEKLTSEIENLKSLIEKANNEKSTLTSEYESKLSNMALTNSLRDLGIGSLASTPIAEKMILDHLKQGATLDGDKIVYKNEDGSTIYNGTNIMTPQTRLESLKSDDNWKPLLKADIAGGGGARESSGGGVQTEQSMNSTELMKQGRK